MLVDGVHHRTIRLGDDGASVVVIDQTKLPERFDFAQLRTLDDAARAIRTMVVRGAPLIGVTAAHGVWLAMRADPSDTGLAVACRELAATRPTAVNLAWALERVRAALAPIAPSARPEAARSLASELADEDAATCESIGRHGARLLRERWDELGRPPRLELLTHCNAGWLATVDWGTALAPIYALADEGFDLHVWCDETRPRDQGLLSAWELGKRGIPATVVADNAGGLLMMQGRVHACIVGADRVTRAGDVCNKVGTYLKALAARAHGVPFFVALPGSTIDFAVADPAAIPIEERDPSELLGTRPFRGHNPAFDLTPRALISRLVTERGTSEASEPALAALFPERASAGRAAEVV
jgi:methylthioribose-1-phosphate isomerase